eukprot:COSAG04_NODE_734_length_10713_cov_2.619748_8_plen_199_part_00
MAALLAGWRSCDTPSCSAMSIVHDQWQCICLQHGGTVVATTHCCSNRQRAVLPVVLAADPLGGAPTGSGPAAWRSLAPCHLRPEPAVNWDPFHHISHCTRASRAHRRPARSGREARCASGGPRKAAVQNSVHDITLHNVTFISPFLSHSPRAGAWPCLLTLSPFRCGFPIADRLRLPRADRPVPRAARPSRGRCRWHG